MFDSGGDRQNYCIFRLFKKDASGAISKRFDGRKTGEPGETGGFGVPRRR